MTTPAREAEAREASVAFHVALTTLGAETIKDALAMWQDVPVGLKPSAAGRWLERAIRLVMFRRRQSRDLALAYYRLARALHTGSTIENPYHPTPETVTLKDLRREFTALVAEQTGHDPGDLSGDGDNDPIPVEAVPDLKAALDQIEQDAERIGSETLLAVGPTSASKKIEKLDTKRAAKEVDKKRDEAHTTAGNRQAGDAARNAMNGARAPIYEIQKRDPKALGWARVSKTGSPCAFCAMLISRGFVYSSKRAAERGEDGDEFHTNCQCYAEPVFSQSQYDNDPRFDMNRELDHLWQNGDPSTGLPANPSLQEWRAWWDEHRKTNTDSPAQAA